MKNNNGFTNKKFKAIILDFDFTLADSSKGVVECVNYALNQMGLKTAENEAIYKTIGLPLPETFMTLTGIKESARIKELTMHFVKRADEAMANLTVLYDTVIPAVNKFKQCNMLLGIVSGKFRYRIEEILKPYSILDSFNIIIGGEDVLAQKPDPEGLLKAITDSCLSKHDILYVGDTTIDAETAKRANVQFSAVLTGVTSHEEFLKYSGIRVFNDLKDLSDWVLE